MLHSQLHSQLRQLELAAAGQQLPNDGSSTTLRHSSSSAAANQARSYPTMANNLFLPSPSSSSVNIFIPTHLFSVISQGTTAGLLFGYRQQNQQNQQQQQKNNLKKTSSSTFHYNITALMPHDEAHLAQLIAQRKADLKRKSGETTSSSSDSESGEHPQMMHPTEDAPSQHSNASRQKRILFLGELVDVSETGNIKENLADDNSSNPTSSASLSKDASYREQLETLKCLWPQFQLTLNFDAAQWPKVLTEKTVISLDSRHLPYSALRLSCLQLQGSNASSASLGQADRRMDFNQVTLLYYDTRNFMSSQLLNRFTSEDQRVDFLEFINESLKKTAQLVNVSSSASEAASSFSSSSSLGENLPTSQTEQPSKVSTIRNDDNKSNQSCGAKKAHRKNASCSSWNDPTLSSLMFLLMPRSLIRAFLYFATTPRHPTSTSAAKQLSPEGKDCSQPAFDQQDRSFLVLQWLLRPLAALSERTPLLARSATVTQLKFRLLQLAICWRLLRREVPAGRRSISLSLGNALSSVFIDVLLGVATIVALHHYSTPGFWLKRAWQYADSMVDDVDRLLRVLQSMPAGLKLNRPLNLALSQFYLYHIYLWESYMDIIRPVFGLVMQAIFYLGIFGFTCILSLLSDIFSLVTIHIYCFYGYGCQLYGLQVSGISALWRLFRGKKYNQLRNRVDSYSYDNEQLFIGTILFTVLLFLLPTVFMYYLVFLVLRFLTLAVQEGLFFFIEHISSMPLYTLSLWLFNSRTISGQVYLEVIDGNQAMKSGTQVSANQNKPDHFQRLQARRQSNRAQRSAISGRASSRVEVNNISSSSSTSAISFSPMIVRLQTKRVSLLSIITSRYDDVLQSLHAYRLSSSAKQLTWNEFFQSILSGRLLHQNLSIGLSLLLFIGYLLLIVYFALNSVST